MHVNVGVILKKKSFCKQNIHNIFRIINVIPKEDYKSNTSFLRNKQQIHIWNFFTAFLVIMKIRVCLHI